MKIRKATAGDYCGIYNKFVAGDGFPVKHGKIERWYHWRCYENEQREIRRARDENRANTKR